MQSRKSLESSYIIKVTKWFAVKTVRYMIKSAKYVLPVHKLLKAM